MSESLEPLVDGDADGWMMLMTAIFGKDTYHGNTFGKAWTIIKFLENEERDYITNKSEAERDL